jgi:putative transposase
MTEVLLSVAQVSKQMDVVVVTYYRWRSDYGGLKIDHAERLEELKSENARFKW